MAIIKMKKMTLAVSDTMKQKVLDELQLVGVAHIDTLDPENIEDGSSSSDSWAKDLALVNEDFSALEDYRKEIANALSRISDLCKKTAPSFEITSMEKIESLRMSYDIKELSEHLFKLDQLTKESDTKKNILQHELLEVKNWSSCIDNFDAVHHRDNNIIGITGQIAESSLSALQEDLFLNTTLVDLLISRVEEKEVFCYIVASKDVWPQISNVLKNHPFHQIFVTRRFGDTQDIIQKITEELQEQVEIYQKCLEQWKFYSSKIYDLALLHDILEMDIQKQKSMNKALASESVNFFRAWIPEELLPKVLAILSIYEKSIDVFVEDPSEDEFEKVPVFLKNNNLTRPFSALTNMYGTPKYGATVDPTPHLSIFYFIYYGICLGDALYGLILAVFSSFMMFKNRANQSMSNFYALLAWSGCSSLIAGIFLGSYAGDLFTKYIPVPFLTDLSFKFSDGSSFFDKPLFVLFISLLMGAVQLWYGYLLKFFVSLKHNVIEALCNEMPWLVLLTGFFGWAVFGWIGSLAGMTLLSPEMNNTMFLLMKIGAGLIILNAIRKGFQKSFFAGVMGPLSGALELYGISGYLSNLLSYARLLALGLSSGIIANVFNQLCMGMIHSLSNITPVLAIFGILLLIFLHIFNLVLGGFGAFVHALRLQFVEFFGQFMEGGGKEYQPLEYKGSHYTVR